jgi:hypothetical protein
MRCSRRSRNWGIRSDSFTAPLQIDKGRRPLVLFAAILIPAACTIAAFSGIHVRCLGGTLVGDLPRAGSPFHDDTYLVGPGVVPQSDCGIGSLNPEF